MRTMPCTPISVKRRASFTQSSAGAIGVALDDALDLAEQAHDRRRRRAQIAEHVAAAGDPFLRLQVDQQQGRPRIAVALVPSTKFSGTSTGVPRTARTVRDGIGTQFAMKSPVESRL